MLPPLLLALFPSSGVAGMVGPIECHSSTSTCPVHPPSSTPHFPYIFYTSFFPPGFFPTWFSVFSVSVRVGLLVHLTFFLVGPTCPSSLLLTCPFHFGLFSVIFFVTGTTFTDPLSCSFLNILSDHIIDIIRMTWPFAGMLAGQVDSRFIEHTRQIDQLSTWITQCRDLPWCLGTEHNGNGTARIYLRFSIC